MKFTKETLSKTIAGSLPENQEKLSRKEFIRQKLAEDPDMIKRGYERGYVVFGDRAVFVRSRWEANICAYYEFLKAHGKIHDWEYEPETFWFEGIKRGTNNYKPDFKITEMRTDQFILDETDTFHWVEVKGYWEQKDTVKQNRMAKYHPNVKMVYILEKQYNDIAFDSHLYPGWGQPFRKKEEVQHLLDLRPPKEKAKRPKSPNKIKNKIVL